MRYTEAQITELLKKHQLKRTAGRVGLLCALAKQSRPVSVATLSDALRGEVDTVTIYRSLELFEHEGIVRRVYAHEGHVDYEFVHEGDHHHHVVCKKCGAIEDIDICNVLEIERRVLQGAKNFSEINGHSLEFFGLCKRCAK